MIAPREAYELVGRLRELAALAELGKQSRLITIWGPGGIGKTRLSLRLMRDAGEAAWFCDLSGAHDAISLCATVAYRLGVQLDSEPVGAIGRHLAKRGAALLVLDNFEQLAHLAGATITAWLDLAPELRIVVTSRERLRLAEESCFELGPLALPSTAAELAGSEAYALLALRLRAVDPTFELSAPAIEQPLLQLLAALEGIPLAIELAAPRVALLGPSALLERLSARSDAISSPPGTRNTPTRQTSLRESMRWSWELLSAADQRALAWCSVFRGGFAIEGAEALLGDEGLERVRALRDASLLRTVRPGRFSLYESVRELASEQLEARGERIEACRQHAAFTATRCAQLALAVEERGEPLERLLEERWNLEQALRWSIASGEREQAVQAVLSLVPILTSQGPLRVLLDALGQALAVAPSDPRLLHARGRVLQALGRLTEAERDLRAALDRADGGAVGARVSKDLGVLEHQRRDVDAAARWYQAALEGAALAGDRRLRAICTGNVGALRHDVGDYDAAEAGYEDALATLRACGDTRTEGVFLTNLAVLHQELERFDRARSGYKRAIDVLRNVGDRRGEGVAIENLAVLEHLDGNLAESREHHERALELLERVGDERSEALCRARLGAVLAQLGSRDAGATQLEKSAALMSDHDDTVASGVREVYRGFVDLADGDRKAAMKRLRTARRGPTPLVAISDDARAAAAVLEAWLAKSSRLRLSLGPNASWFQVSDGAPQTLEARPTHARLLGALADVHAIDPEQRLDVSALFEVGWPAQSATHESAQNRVHVTLAQLRKLGLAPALQHSDEGYRLDPEWLIVRKRNAR